MRTRTNVYFGSGIEGAIRAMKNLYPAGRVLVISDDADEGERICELLSDEKYAAAVSPVDRSDPPTEDFCFGVGGEGAVLSTIRMARGKSAFCPTTLLPELFSGSCGRLAEFSYFDTDFFTIDSPRFVSECYAGLFCALTEGVAKLYDECRFPFADGSLRGLVERGREILLGRSDRQTFVSDCVYTTSAIVECLLERGVTGFVSTDAARYLGGGVKNRNLSAYFLNRLLILFTKWNFRDMLIPTESATFSTVYRAEDLVLTGQDLGRMATLFKNDVSEPNLQRLVAAMRSAVGGKNSLFGEIFLRGLPEGLIGYG